MIKGCGKRQRNKCLSGKRLKEIISCMGRFLNVMTGFKKEYVAEHSCFVLLLDTNIHHWWWFVLKMKNVSNVLCQDLLPFWAPDNAAERWQMPLTNIPASINIWAPVAPARLLDCPLYRNVLAVYLQEICELINPCASLGAASYLIASIWLFV